MVVIKNVLRFVNQFLSVLFHVTIHPLVTIPPLLSADFSAKGRGERCFFVKNTIFSVFRGCFFVRKIVFSSFLGAENAPKSTLWIIEVRDIVQSCTFMMCDNVPMMCVGGSHLE